MSKASALSEAKELKAIMTGEFLVACSIELQIGRPVGSLDRWHARLFQFPMNHHTAGPHSGLTPSINVIKRGRSDLPPPLSNGYGGRDYVYRIITLGPANHPGLGGPMRVADFLVPRNNARPYAWGTEWEHDGVSSWDPKMREFMGRANAAICTWKHWEATRSREHNSWAPLRKIDRNGYDAGDGQREIQHWLDWADNKDPKPKPHVPTPPADHDTRVRTVGLQKALEIPADGVWGPQTDEWAQRLRNAAFEKTGGGPDKDWDVRKVQKVVDTAEDGKFGPQSLAKLKSWVGGVQKNVLGVTADGAWGSKTDKAYQALRDDAR